MEQYIATRMTPAIDHASRVRGFWPAVVPPEDWAKPAHKLQLWGAADHYEDCVRTFGHQVDILYHPSYLSVGPKGVDKGWGMVQLAQHLGVSTSAILAVGDDRNDIRLLQRCGMSVAVGFAPPEVRAAATYWLAGDSSEAVQHVLTTVLESRLKIERRS
jgi:hydroxymethylpyrimidine pyrophosphatase-like HAD family hydrolase